MRHYQKWLTLKHNEIACSKNVLYEPYNKNGLKVQRYDDNVRYYGIEGRKRALVRLLEYAQREPQGSYIWIYSDESLSILLNDETFQKKVEEGLKLCLKRSIKIIVIQNVYNYVTEIMANLHKLLKLYRCGIVETYYYPKLKNNLLTSTMIMVGTTCSLVATSIESNLEVATAEIYMDKKMNRTLKRQFDMIIKRCRKLIYVYNLQELTQKVREYSTVGKVPSDCISICNGFTFFTATEGIIEKVAYESKCYILLDYYKSILCYMEKLLEYNKYIEVIPMPTKDKILKNRYKITHFKEILNLDVMYTLEDYISHIKNIILFIDTHYNYNIVLSKYLDGIIGESSIFVKGNESVTLYMKENEYSNGRKLFKIKHYAIASVLYENIRCKIEEQNELQGNEARDYLVKLVADLEEYMSNNETTIE